MPRSPANNQQIKDARRTDILRAATRVFAKKGFADAKISDVAKEAGLSHGLVYHYFENKDAVFKAILEDKLTQSRKALEEDDSLPGTSLDRMRASLGRWFERVQAEPAMSILITQALVGDALAPDVRVLMRKHMREAYLSSTARIAQGQAEGAIGDHATADELAACLICFMRGLAVTTMIDFGVKFTMPSVDTVARMILPDEAIAARPARTTKTVKTLRQAARIARAPKKARPATPPPTASATTTVRKASR